MGWRIKPGCLLLLLWRLSNQHKSILIRAIDNWYDFGLIVTEHSLVTAYFEEVESRIGRHITLIDYSQNFLAMNALREFIKLKSEWPYRRSDAPGACNFFFENGLYPRPTVFRATPDIRQSSFEKILKELDAGFSSTKEIEAANELLNDLFLKTERALMDSI